MLAAVQDFLEALGHEEEPIGVYYTNKEPENGFAPDVGPPYSRSMELNGEIDWQGVWGSFSCIMGNVWLGRKKKKPAYLDRERYGCLGGAFYAGFHHPQLEFISQYVSTGAPGVTEGERYLASPQAAQAFFDRLAPRPAPARFCVMKPLSIFLEGEKPELVTFFCRGEVLTGLHMLLSFVTNDLEVVAAPFGAGCSNMIAWPLRYLEEGKMRAVLGGLDPSCRKFYKTDEMSLSMPLQLFEKVLDSWRDSFITGKNWADVRKKVLRSRKAWGERLEEC